MHKNATETSTERVRDTSNRFFYLVTKTEATTAEEIRSQGRMTCWKSRPPPRKSLPMEEASAEKIEIKSHLMEGAVQGKTQLHLNIFEQCLQPFSVIIKFTRKGQKRDS